METSLEMHQEVDGIAVRDATTGDIPGIASLFTQQLNRVPNTTLIEDAVANYPSAVAVGTDGKTIGFAYCGYMAPDLLELMNITVHSEYRSSGLGTRILQHVEAKVFEERAALMLTNSALYTGDGEKRSASNFYLRNGYSIVASTGATNLFWKSVAS